MVAIDINDDDENGGDDNGDGDDVVLKFLQVLRQPNNDHTTPHRRLYLSTYHKNSGENSGENNENSNDNNNAQAKITNHVDKNMRFEKWFRTVCGTTVDSPVKSSPVKSSPVKSSPVKSSSHNSPIEGVFHTVIDIKSLESLELLNEEDDVVVAAE